jgi:hypothetical protein
MMSTVRKHRDRQKFFEIDEQACKCSDEHYALHPPIFRCRFALPVLGQAQAIELDLWPRKRR